VKFQRLQPFFPDSGSNSEILYFVSSCLPHRWLPTYWEARRDGRRIVWNQSAVSYRAVWPEVRWDDDNMLLENGLHAADYVVYQSHFSREVADRFLGPFAGPSEILYNAVDTRHFAPRPGERQPGEALTILLGGTQYRFTSVEIAFTALAALRRRERRARLLVTGSMSWIPDSTTALQQARSRAVALGVGDAVEFLGEYTQAEAPEIFRSADVLIHTRYDDLCPNVVIEAMSCGLPIVYSSTGGTPELVGDEAGIGVETGHRWDEECFADPEQWADALEQVASDPARFAEAARRRALERFDLAPWVARHAGIFDQVLGSPPVKARARTPESGQLRQPLQLIRLMPDRVRQGERFNLQPDGRSAIAITTENATLATLVVLDDEVMDTSFTSAAFVSATVPFGFTNNSGTHRVRLSELLRESNAADFEIEAAGAQDAGRDGQ
jgi:glycosyltransferase involved in cell wall biosynthesis